MSDRPASSDLSDLLNENLASTAALDAAVAAAAALRAAAARQPAEAAAALRTIARSLDALADAAEVLGTKVRVLELEGRLDEARLARAEHLALQRCTELRSSELLAASREDDGDAALLSLVQHRRRGSPCSRGSCADDSGMWSSGAAASASEMRAAVAPDPSRFASIESLRPTAVALPPSPRGGAHALQPPSLGAACPADSISPGLCSDPSHYLLRTSARLASPAPHKSRSSLAPVTGVRGSSGVVLPHGGIAPSEVLRAGWLTKRSVGRTGESPLVLSTRAWRSRYVVLTASNLWWFSSEAELRACVSAPLGALRFSHETSVRAATAADGVPGECLRILVGAGVELWLLAKSSTERDAWRARWRARTPK